jgi:ribosomal protein L32
LAVVAAIALVALVTSAISDWLLLGVGAALLGVVIVLVSCLVAGGLKRGARRFMAYGNPNLVACPDCGRTISRNAMACPKCGRPMEHKSPLR